ncbi:ATPase [Streptomyces subrutilus]|uniref:histidine kinase n=1 Tax=Streptomyces subrutilus TaxID=36818 RepID=A0A5P2UMR7_9ACTN|nr:ATP-binding protein [Streptomyces subrutilus]QEU77937.1 ATP-binding protein [Streptomyces subrutilus]GGZ63474.1 ATPase [Streptomyces subrutilus]
MSGPRAARHAPSRHAVTGAARQKRPPLARAAVLPTLAAGLSGAAAVIFTLQLGGGAGERDPRLWPVLTGCALLVVAALAAALLSAQRSAKAVHDRCEALRRSSVRGRQELRIAADLLVRGETPPRPVRTGPAAPSTDGDAPGLDGFRLLSQELRAAREQAHTTLVRLAGRAAPSDSDRKVEVFVALARRLQSLVHREISLLDGQDTAVEDPALRKELRHADHLAARIRRHAENLAVLGGAASRRQWTRPVELREVLRCSVAEVEQHARVKVVPPAAGGVRGHAVADVVHLLAELVENAAVFSASGTDVTLRAERVAAGIAIEVEDRGPGLPAAEQQRMNALLDDPDQAAARALLADGRTGLFVVGALARRHGIAVELKSNIYGGVLAVLVLPRDLLAAQEPPADTDTDTDAGAGSRTAAWATGEREAAPPLEPVRVGPPRQPPPGTATARPPATGTPWPGRPAPDGPWTPAAETAQPASGVRAGRASGEPSGDGGAGDAYGYGPSTAPDPGPPAPEPAPARAAGDGPAPGSPYACVPGSAAPAEAPGGPLPEVPAARRGEGRPELPRRHARRHLAPRLLEIPAPAPPADADEPLHDPALMAAFRRGFGLARPEGQP